MKLTITIDQIGDDLYEIEVSDFNQDETLFYVAPSGPRSTLWCWYESSKHWKSQLVYDSANDAIKSLMRFITELLDYK